MLEEIVVCYTIYVGAAGFSGKESNKHVHDPKTFNIFVLLGLDLS